MRTIYLWRSGLALLAAGILAACSDDGPAGPQPVSAVEITGDTSALALSQTRQLGVVLRDASGGVLSGRAVSWSSSAPALAEIDAAGLVTAKGTGDVTITATVEGTSATRQLHVRPSSTVAASGTTIHVNPGDPVLATRAMGDGRVFQILGERNAAGDPVRITGTRTVQAGSGRAGDLVTYNANGLPREVMLDSAGYAAFDYSADGRARVTFVLPDGTTAEAGFDVSGPALRASARRSSGHGPRRHSPAHATRPQWLPTRLHAFDRTQLARLAGETGARPATAAAETRTVTIRVSVNARSGAVTAPVGGATVVNYVGSNDVSLLTPYTGHEVSEGVYESTVAFDPAPFIDLARLNSLCEQIDDKTSAPCDALEQSGFEAEFAALCVALVGVPEVGVLLVRLCQAVVAGIVVVCGPVVELGCALGSTAYDHLPREAGMAVFTRVSGKDYSAQASTNAPAPVPPLVPVEVTLPLLLSIRINPADPAEYEDYVATTLTRPAVSGLAVRMSIVGTDGYTDSRSGATDALGTFRLAVPGAEGGVLDVITSTVGDQTRTTSIVF